MDRRHQVFISSTFTDLIDERREVMQALLEMDCLPAGMELFPAGNSDQWTLIKGVIEQSDYYLIIIGGRYGSMTAEGISYTEKEYDYAVELGIPIIGFVPADAEAIPVGKTDKNSDAAQKLSAFQAKVQTRMTKEWKNAEDLGSKVSRALTRLMKTEPRPGWVRGDQALSPESRAEIAELKAKIAELEKRELQSLTEPVQKMDERFAHGDEALQLDLVHIGTDDSTFALVEESGSLTYTWDAIFMLLGPYMVDEAPETQIRSTLNSHMLTMIYEESDDWSTNWMNQQASITDRSWGAITVQFRALGLIELGTKKRAPSDKSVYWKLTPAGDNRLIKLRAFRSTNIASAVE